MPFLELGLSENIVRAIMEHGYTQPTPIQIRAIPAVLAGGDLLAGAQTGTGKTAGFVLPILQLLSSRPGGAKRVVRTLILAPTRELCAQVEESVKTYGKYAGRNSLAVYGGVGINPQISALRRGVDILVATPGRLLDLVQQNALDLSHVEILVLDEADRMLDMGFIKDIRRILALLPAKRQNLLFSATFSDEIKELAASFLTRPALIEVTPRNSTVELIAQKMHPVDRDRKRELLEHLITTHDWRQVLVFMRTKHGANRLAEQLEKSGITALAIHGNKSQPARMKALAQFKSGQLRVLVATDIAARGIDIDQLPHVVNYDMPNVPEDYVHRIGRTGRAGAPGEAVSLVCVDEKQFLSDIERLIRRQIPQEVIPGFEPDPTAKPQPIQLRSAGHTGQRQSAPRQKTQARPQGQPRQGTQAKHGEPRAAGGQRAGGPRQGPAKHVEQRHGDPQRRPEPRQAERPHPVLFGDDDDIQPQGVRHDAPRADDPTKPTKPWSGYARLPGSMGGTGAPPRGKQGSRGGQGPGAGQPRSGTGGKPHGQPPRSGANASAGGPRRSGSGNASGGRVASQGAPSQRFGGRGGR
jgi:ATP-dependent RNA helicase RhlE